MILLTGANGQLGQELTALAAADGVALAGLGHADLDIADGPAVQAVLERLRPTVIVNAAAYTKVDAAESNEALAFRVNEEGPRQLARAAAHAGIPLIHVSTDYVFDGTKDGWYTEDDPVAPLGVYGRSKAAGEAAVRVETPAHVIIRTSWVYGTYGANILKTVLRLAGERDELRFVADQHGCPTATPDLARAVITAAIRATGAEPAFGTFHFAGQGDTTWFGFVDHVVAMQARHTQRRPKVIPIRTSEFPTPARRPANSRLESRRFAKVFGFASRTWQEAATLVIDKLLASSGGQSGD